MTIVPFYTRFPDLAWQEMRSIDLISMPGLPAGQYGFLELYCEDPRCDCQRVIIQVVSPVKNSPIWATINYGWESLAYYEQWIGHGYAELAKEMEGARLDPINPQTKYADMLLELFKVQLSDTIYVERLKRHYTLFKASFPAPPKRPKMSSQKQKPKRRK